jgi:IS4 transposase
MFPRKLLEVLARQSRLVIRKRVFDPVRFFWALLETILGGSCASIANVKRAYERLTKRPFDAAEFYSRVGSPAMVKFLQLCFGYACEHVFPEAQRPVLLQRFTQALIQDSSVLRLRDKLAGRLPGSATPAACKINVIMNAGSGKPSKIQFAKGTKAEVKFMAINSSLAGALLIADLGYFCYQRFARIENNEGFFLFRLKDNANPTIVGSNLVHRGQAMDLVGKRIREVIGSLKREILDLQIDVEVNLKGSPGPIPEGGHRPHKRHWRIVGLRNAETGEYHVYITNVSPEILTAEEVGLAYSYRWEVELLFKELKGVYDLGAWRVTNEDAVLVQTYGVLVAWAVSRRLREVVLGKEARQDPLAASLAAPLLRFALVLAGYIRDIIGWVLANRRAPRHLLALLRSQARDPNRRRPALGARTERVTRNARVVADAA